MSDTRDLRGKVERRFHAQTALRQTDYVGRLREENSYLFHQWGQQIKGDLKARATLWRHTDQLTAEIAELKRS